MGVINNIATFFGMDQTPSVPLTNKKVKDTYQSLIKTVDNQPINDAPKELTDGLGNKLPISIGTNGILFEKDIDFTNASVTGAQVWEESKW